LTTLLWIILATTVSGVLSVLAAGTPSGALSLPSPVVALAPMDPVLTQALAAGGTVRAALVLDQVASPAELAAIRATGLAAAETRTSHAVGQPDDAQSPAAGEHEGHVMPPADAKKVPGFPQDMWMTMDDAVARPETHGMAPGWTGAMMGMMTVVRVLEPALFDRIQELKAEQTRAGGPQ